MNEHTGFHEYKDGRRFNPECLKCLAIERDWRKYLLEASIGLHGYKENEIEQNKD